MDKHLRVFFLDTLIAHSGKQLVAETIGEITQELVERALEVFNYKKEESNNEKNDTGSCFNVACNDEFCTLPLQEKSHAQGETSSGDSCSAETSPETSD